MAQHTQSARPLSNRDLELLSAYIDGELNATQQARLERRLAQDAALQAELEALQVTVMLVQSLPERQVPRNFTLDAAQYGNVVPTKRSRLLSISTPLVAAGASLLLVAVCVGVVLLAGSPTSGRLSAPLSGAADMVELESAVEMEAEEPAEEEAAEEEAEIALEAEFSVADEAVAEEAAVEEEESAAIELQSTDTAEAEAAVPAAEALAEPPSDAETENQDASLPTAEVRVEAPESVGETGGAGAEVAEQEGDVATGDGGAQVEASASPEASVLVPTPSAQPTQALEAEAPDAAQALSPEVAAAEDDDTAAAIQPPVEEAPAPQGTLRRGIAIGAAVALVVLFGGAVVAAIVVARRR